MSKLETLPHRQKPYRKLIINADDFGLSRKFNDGILELIDKEIVTSTTVMINRKFVEPKKILKRKNTSIGLHLELSFESTREEIEDQIKKFKNKFGKLPSHLDSHRHLHLFPGNFPKVLQIAKKYKLPIRSIASLDKKMVKAAGIKTPDHFISWHPNRKKSLLKKLSMAKGRVVELVCHPGHFDPKSKSSYNKQREKELEFLKSSAFEKATRDFALISYTGL